MLADIVCRDRAATIEHVWCLKRNREKLLVDANGYYQFDVSSSAKDRVHTHAQHVHVLYV